LPELAAHDRVAVGLRRLPRERYWLTFQPGEIRAGTNCHGVNTADVFGGPIPQNEPAALRELVRWWAAPEADAIGAGIVALLALGGLRRFAV